MVEAVNIVLLGLLVITAVAAIRLHAVGITDTLGAAAILLGLAFIAGWGLLLVKLFLILAVLLLLNPTASHALGRAAVHGARRPWLSAPK
jgi:multicomponent Na+:H+ antiporter subunit G